MAEIERTVKVTLSVAEAAALLAAASDVMEGEVSGDVDMRSLEGATLAILMVMSPENLALGRAREKAA